MLIWNLLFSLTFANLLIATPTVSENVSSPTNLNSDRDLPNSTNDQRGGPSSFSKTISLHSAQATSTFRPIDKSVSILDPYRPNTGKGSVALENGADVVMGFVLVVTFFAFAAALYKVFQTGIKAHQSLNLAFQSAVMTLQIVALIGRLTDFPNRFLVVLCWIGGVIALWNRLHCIRMTRLLVPEFASLAKYFYIATILFFAGTIGPLFAWYLVRDQIVFKVLSAANSIRINELHSGLL